MEAAGPPTPLTGPERPIGATPDCGAIGTPRPAALPMPVAHGDIHMHTYIDKYYRGSEFVPSYPGLLSFSLLVLLLLLLSCAASDDSNRSLPVAVAVLWFLFLGAGNAMLELEGDTSPPSMPDSASAFHHGTTAEV